MDKKKNLIYRIFFGISISIVAIAVVGLTILNTMQTTKITEEDTTKYVSEISYQVNGVLKDRIQRTLSSVISTAEYLKIFEKVGEPINEERCRKILEITAKSLDLERIFLYNPRTETLIADVKTEINTLSPLPEEISYYKSVIDIAVIGTPKISIMDIKSAEGSGALVFGIPYQGAADTDQADAVLVAVMARSVMREFLNVDIFGGKVLIHVVDPNGIMLVVSVKRPPIVQTDSFFDFISEDGVTIEGNDTLEEYKECLKNNQPFYMYFSLQDQQRKIFKSMSFDIPGGDKWNLICVMPTDVTNQKMQGIITDAVAINYTIATLFVGFTLLLFALHSTSQKRLTKLAFVDDVTNGMSATYFDIECKDRLTTASPNQYAFVYFDVDRFKIINDVYGSQKGNEMLRHIGKTLTSKLSKGEIAVRRFADKFNMLLNFTDHKEFYARIDDIIYSINQFNENIIDKYYLSFSIGVCVVDDCGLDLITIQDRANSARKKCNIGFTKYGIDIFFSDEERRQLRIEKEIENQMEAALQNEEFIVYLQPKYELIRESISGAEALVRWNHPTKGLIPPGLFISVFEKNGFITQLDLFVFDKVCQLIGRWLEKGTKVTVSVNVSKVHLKDPNFMQKYADVYAKYGFPADCIEIEFTETLVNDNLEELKKVIDAIHQIGFRCSLDDFGSGYSSLNLLKDLSVDTIKLDKVFFDKTDKRSEKIIESIIRLAKKLKMVTVSEGVEQRTQVEFLKKVKCDLVQGYVFSKPLPIEQFEKLLFLQGVNIQEEDLS